MERIRRPRLHASHRARLASPLAARGLAVLGIALLFGGWTLSVAGSPGPRIAVRLTAADARGRGVAPGLLARHELGETLVTLAMPDAGDAADPGQLLDVARNGGLAAIADRPGPLATELIIAAADGAQLRIPTAGLLAATFSPDASWLAVIDGAGTLRRTSALDGTTGDAVPGPFLGHPIVTADGDLLLLSVSSVEAPFRSRLVRVTDAGEVSEPLTDDELVYAATLLDDGALAIVAHTPSGSVVRRLQDGVVKTTTTLAPGAIHVAVSPDGSQVAWEIDGDGVYVRTGRQPATRIGTGSRPRFAPDGRVLLLDGSAGPRLFRLADGQALQLDATAAAFVVCNEECGS